jgi:hypothetical protein
MAPALHDGGTPAEHDGGTSAAEASRPDTTADLATGDTAPPSCPAEAPVTATYPFTPLPCSLAESAAHLACPFDLAADHARFPGCHVTFRCDCVSSQAAGVPPTCVWIPGPAGYQCPGDGGTDAPRPPDGGRDGGALACGGMTCGPDQYCVSKSGGPAPRCFPHPDGGPCPARTTEGCSFPPGPGCQEITVSYACTTLPTTCAAQEPCRCLCGLPPGPTGGCFIADRRVSCAYP